MTATACYDLYRARVLRRHSQGVVLEFCVCCFFLVLRRLVRTSRRLSVRGVFRGSISRHTHVTHNTGQDQRWRQCVFFLLHGGSMDLPTSSDQITVDSRTTCGTWARTLDGVWCASPVPKLFSSFQLFFFTRPATRPPPGSPGIGIFSRAPEPPPVIVCAPNRTFDNRTEPIVCVRPGPGF